MSLPVLSGHDMNPRDERETRAVAPLHEGQGKIRLVSLLSLSAATWLLAAPFVLGYATSTSGLRGLGVDLATGSCALSLASYHALNWQTGRSASRVVVSLGLWLVVAPVCLGYKSQALHTAAINDLLCGALLIGGAALMLAGSHPPPESNVRKARANRLL